MNGRRNITAKLAELRERPDCLASRLLFYIPCVSIIVVYLFAYRTIVPLPFDGKAIFIFLEVGGVAAIAIREALFGCWNKRTAGLFAVIAIIGASGFLANWPALAGTCLFAFAARDMDLKQVVTVTGGAIVVVIAITLACSFTGIADNGVVNPDDPYDAKRHLLGFYSPNTLGLLAFGVIGAFLVVRERALRVWEVLAALGIAIAIFIPTLSRTAILVTTFTLLLALAASRLPERAQSSRILGGAVALFVPAIAIAALAITWAYNPDIGWMQQLDRLLSRRLGFGHMGAELFPITPFGQEIQMPLIDRYSLHGDELVVRQSPLPIDCFYTSLLLHSGVIPTIAFLALYAWACVLSLRSGNPVTTAVLLGIAVYALSESGAMHIYYAPAVMCLAWAFREKPETEET